MKYGFDERLEFSKGASTDACRAALLEMIPGAIGVDETPTEIDRKGVDLVVRLSDGGVVLVDHKTRHAGCSRYWKKVGKSKIPEVALEVWSVMPGGKYRTPPSRQRVGWTKDGMKQTHLILFMFDPQDSQDVFLVSFHLLRSAFMANEVVWKALYRRGLQESDGWESECLFVPITEVQRAIYQASILSTASLLRQISAREQYIADRAYYAMTAGA